MPIDENDPSGEQTALGRSNGSDAILPLGDRLDEIVQERFNRKDWVEVAAAVLLAVATIVAAWSAYQATRWSGVQANASSLAGATRAEAAEATTIFSLKAQSDTQMWIFWLEQFASEDPETSLAFVEERFRDEFRPAFDAWLAQTPVEGIPPETPLTMEEYQPAERRLAP